MDKAITTSRDTQPTNPPTPEEEMQRKTRKKRSEKDGRSLAQKNETQLAIPFPTCGKTLTYI